MKPRRVRSLLIHIFLASASAVLATAVTAGAAQTFGFTGDIVEMDWSGVPTKAKVEHCTSNACDLYLWDAGSATWSGGTLSQPKDKIRGLRDGISAGVGTPQVAGAHADQLAAQGGAWKPGDRVAVRVGMEWVPSVIVRNDLPGISPYEVQFDGHSERDNTSRQPAEIRPRTAATTALAACPTVDGAAMGSAALVASFKSVIRDKFLATANNTGTAPMRVSVAFQSFQVGSPRTAALQIENGANVEPAPIGALVYPVSSMFAVCRYYRSEGIVDNYDGHYECFKSRRGDQVCGVSQGHHKITSTQLATGR